MALARPRRRDRWRTSRGRPCSVTPRGSSYAGQRSVPDPDSGKFVVVGQNAQSARIEQEMLSGARWKPDPPRHEDAEDVSVRKQSDIPVNSADPGDDSIHPGADLLRRFTARATVAENQPVGRLLVDLLGREPLVFAVVPFGELGIDDGCVAETRQLTGLTRAPHWTDENARERL